MNRLLYQLSYAAILVSFASELPKLNKRYYNRKKENVKGFLGEFPEPGSKKRSAPGDELAFVLIPSGCVRKPWEILKRKIKKDIRKDVLFYLVTRTGIEPMLPP